MRYETEAQGSDFLGKLFSHQAMDEQQVWFRWLQHYVSFAVMSKMQKCFTVKYVAMRFGSRVHDVSFESLHSI